MKRFALKRITALVLALVMTLSLLPMTVWAEEEGEGEQNQQLYWKYNPQDGEWMTGQLWECFGGSSWLTLAADDSGTPLADNWTVSAFAVGLGNVFKAPDGRLCWDHSAVRNYASGEIEIKSGETTYSIFATVGESELRAYIGDEEKFADFENCHTYTSGNNAVITFKVNEDMTIDQFIGVDSGWASIAADGKSATLTVPDDVYGRLEFQVGCTRYWMDGEQQNSQSHTRYFRFRDTNDQSDLFCRAIWGSNKDRWSNGRFGGQAGELMTVEFALPPQNGGMPADDAVMSLEGATVTISENFGTAKISNNQVLWDCTRLSPDSTGTMKITKDEITYNIPLVITPAPVSVYSTAPDYDNLGKNYMVFDQNRFYTYVPSASEPQVFYLLAREGMTFMGTPDQWPEGLKVLDGTDGRLATYTIPADSYGRKNITVEVLQTWDNGSQKIDWWIGFTEAERHNAVVGSDGLTGNKEYYPVPIGNTGYYIGPGFSLYDVLKPMSGGYQLLTEGGQINSGIAVGIWKMAPDGVTLELLEGAELAAVTERLKSLNMDIKLVAENNNDNKEYPFIREISETGDPEYHKILKGENKYPLAKIYTYTQYSTGVWCFTLTGTYTDVDGTDIPFTAYGRDEKRITKMENVSIPAQGTAEATVKYINDLLQDYAGRDYVNKSDTEFILEVNLPEGTLRGYINVPENICGLNLWGKTDADYNISTKLEGGIIANNFDVRVANIQFVGAGRDVKMWEGTTQPNKAIYGTAGGGAVHCSFTGYDCAIEMHGGVIGAGGLTDGEGHPLADTGVFFYDNNVAIKQAIEGDFFSGDTQYWKMVMVNNGTDIDFEKANGWGGYSMAILSAIFVRNDNKNSIHNTGGRTFFMPMTVFYNTKNETNNGNNDPQVDGNVSIAPYYTLTEAGKTALVTNLKTAANVEAMLRNPTYKEEWISTERLFPRSWICPANPDTDIYSVSSNNITEDEMTIDIIDNYNDDAYVGTIKLKKNK